jgi:hypothetical protein
MITKYPPDNKCPRCQGYLFDCVDMVDGSHYIGCGNPRCARIEYEDGDEYDAYDAAYDKADHEYHYAKDEGLL